MNITVPVRGPAMTLAGFVALSLLPCVMNAFPQFFAHAFSEHPKNWTATTLVLMTTVIVVWSWSAIRLGRLGHQWHTAARPPIASPIQISPSVATRILTLSRHACVLHGPILIGLFYLMWVAARLALGRWPQYGGADDPKSIIGSAVVHAAIWLWLVLAPLAIALPLFRTGVAVSRRDGSVSKPALESIATVLLLSLSMVYLSTDPHHLVTWFLD